MGRVRALIADDEVLLRGDLRKRLSRLWPELEISGEAENGPQALQLAGATRPDLVFLDIRMPGLSGLEVARQLGGDCRVVFVTAYDQYAVEAFESAAVDYLLKPIADDRLAVTVARLRREMERDRSAPPDLTALLEKVTDALGGKHPKEPLRWVRASQGEAIRLVPVEEVCYFQARDKYTAVVTDTREFLIRTSIQQLEETLDPECFWRVHRGAIVNLHRVEVVSRHLGGRLALKIRGRPEALMVSRGYAQRFRQM